MKDNFVGLGTDWNLRAGVLHRAGSSHDTSIILRSRIPGSDFTAFRDA